MTFFVFPAVETSGPEGGKILSAITGTNRFPQVLTWVSALTVLTGYLMMWHLSGGFALGWFTTRYGMSLALGGATALIAFLQVFFINRPGIYRVQSIGRDVAAKGGVPSDEERNEMMKIRKRVVLSTRWIAFWLMISIVSMAGARYF